MSDSQDPVVVFHGQDEFEAQAARDVLGEAEIPVLHVPSLSTGIFGMRRTTQVAVPGEYVEEALAALEEAGMTGRIQPRRRGMAAFQETMEDVFPRGRSPLPRRSSLGRILWGLGAAILLLWFLILFRRFL